MALTKVVYTDDETVIGAQNLNDIQDEIISNASTIAGKYAKPPGGIPETDLSQELLLKAINDFVTPQMYGAKNDGSEDATNAFNAAQNSGKNVFVPAGQYKLTNFIFSTSITWIFQRSNGNQWFAAGGAKILSETTLQVTHGAKIYNLCVQYSGSVQNPENRPICLSMKSHFCEIHGFWESGWYIGMDFGDGTGGHSDYTKIYDAYCWYNYFCGVRLNGSNNAQVNFISFYDCNVGSNGVDVHQSDVAPNTARGYGFYIGTANSVAINNADVSSNETCGIFIDNNHASKRARGIFIGAIYAEHNKYCDVYYNNNNSLDSTTCRSGNIVIESPYFEHTEADIYCVGQYHAEQPYIPPTVKMALCPHDVAKECESFLLNASTDTYDIDVDKSVKNFTFYAKPLEKYHVTLKLEAVDTGQIVFQNVIYGVKFHNNFFDNANSRVGTLTAYTANVTAGETSEISFDLTMPSTSEYSILRYTATGYGSGSSAKVIDGRIERVST